jgi:excisionase family DNA binding protein
MQNPSPSPSPRRLVYSVDQAAFALGIGRTTCWKLIKEQKIRAIKLALRRTGFTVEEVERFRLHGIGR